MPPIDKHARISLERTGNDYLALHEWIDKDPDKKVERHDIKKMVEYGRKIEAEYGAEGLQEYIQHIHDDFLARFSHVKEDLDQAIDSTLEYFGVGRTKDNHTTDTGIPLSDLVLLLQAGLSDKDLGHSVRVACKAIDVAHRIKREIDVELVRRGALLHDLGKARTHGFDHGIAGSEIGRLLGLPDAITTIMEKHVNAGLTEQEAVELSLPPKDYSPDSLEEKIVIYADKLSDIIAHPDGIVSDESEAERVFVKIVAADPKLNKGEKPLERHVRYHREIQELME